MPETVVQSNRVMRILSNSNVALAAGVILILTVMILPLPTFLMDVLLVMNITGALVMLFVSIYILKPLEFSVFPSLLLIVTLFRLSLNVATTRLILTQAYAGELIQAFGSFVVRGNYFVGIIIFLILVIINFIVITKGATRIAEVSARFTLDAMPGKQMSIDADLNAGLIDDQEAQRRREQIVREADFYGAMDGASKFVRGDAIAGLLITAINIIGGLIIGVLQRGMPIGEAASTYTILTVGDGLVAQIPALIISTSAGIIITRASSESNLGTDISAQITRQPKAIFVTSGVLALMGLVPGMPFFPFMIMAAIMAGSGYLVEKALKIQEAMAKEEEVEETAEAEEKIEEFLHPDPFEVEIGYGLIPLVDVNQGGNLLRRISTIRKSIAIELGVIVPPIRIRDNIQLKSNEYVFKIYGVECARYELMMGYYLVLNPDDRAELKGIDTVEPTFGLPAKWIPKSEKEKAELAGYTVIEPVAVIATHLMEVLKNNAYKLLDRQETQRMLDHLKETHPAVVEGVVPDIVNLGTVTQVLKNLLKERIPIRNLVTIMETLADYGAMTKDSDVLTEYVRNALAEVITGYYKQDKNYITVITLDPRLEDKIMENVRSGNGRSQNLGFTPDQVNKIFSSLAEKVEKAIQMGVKPVLLTSPHIRRYVRNFIDPVLPNLAVLSYNELTPDTELKTVGSVEYPNEN
ncbi:MAG: flagellar biosynthesis protein FlhA [Candidatus Marinimicrobia bacterium]|nr:flagellar biosynthesis protein FlhA [Candidatus Neomarinimicrobiota bacterium]